jgi:hypothetical protein
MTENNNFTDVEQNILKFTAGNYVLPAGSAGTAGGTYPWSTKVQFDGFEFDLGWQLSLPNLHLAALARRGDRLAAELLDKFGVSVRDGEGVSYWPISPPVEASMASCRKPVEDADLPIEVISP